MNSKNIFKILSKLSLILFYLVTLAGVVTLVMESFTISNPNSKIAKSYGGFEPIYSYINLNFLKQPDLYMEKSFMLLSLVSNATAFLLVIMFLWFMQKLLKNIYEDSLFMYENASIILKLGITIMIVGTISEYTNGLLTSKALTYLQISNAQINFINIAYFDLFITGTVLIIIAVALKRAVHAVEENKKTI